MATLSYSQELEIKTEALRQFWRENRIGGEAGQIVESPLPRHYRTTSKRRLLVRGGRAVLMHADGRREATTPSLLEPSCHAEVYRALESWLLEPRNQPAARVLSWVIIRGTYEELVVIFNVRSAGTESGKVLRHGAQRLQERVPAVKSAFLFHDPTGSDYYLEADRPPDALEERRLVGYDRYRLTLEQKTLLVDPFCFAQVNLSVVPRFLACARDLLAPRGNDSLLDLYCGWGLFSHYLGSEYRTVTGVEVSRRAVACAVANAHRYAHRARMAFRCGDISPSNLERLLPEMGPDGEDVIVDPPRSGIDERVVAAIAAREPRRVVHVFCGTDEIPRSTAAWKQSGYEVTRVLPVDMFPGTLNLETLVLLEPAQSRRR